MKLSVGFFAGLAAADVSVSEPVKSLQRLTVFSAEILQSGVFDHKPEKWRQRWTDKFQRNAARMERNVGRQCGFYDADIHSFDYDYDAGNACNGIKMITDGYSRWSENHLSLCYGQRRRKHQQNRMNKWSDLLAEDCKATSYTFVIPGDDWWAVGGYIYKGQSFEFSAICNPDFKDIDGWDCKDYSEYGYCDTSAHFLFYYSIYDEHDILETALQCPQCGCGSDGAANLNDVYADKGRKLSTRKN